MKLGQRVSSEQAMRKAIALAKKGFPTVRDNPAVGCVIVDKDHCFLAAGYHRESGNDHAEIDALKNLCGKNNLLSDVTGDVDHKLNGAHVYVTLEPCAFAGRTGSCAQALAALPIASVTIGCKDPHPKVDGQGVRILEQAGIEVRFFEGYHEAFSRLIEFFDYHQREKKAFVALKVGTSLDGQLAMKSGESRWITGEASREYVHELRHRHQGIMVGAGTFLADDPKLNVRLSRTVSEFDHSVFVLDPNARGLEALSTSQLVKLHSRERLFWVVRSDLDQEIKDRLEQFVQLIEISESNGELDLHQLKKELYKREIFSVFVEGGAKTHSMFLRQKAADRLYQFIAPVIIGDESGKTWSEELAISSLSEKVILRNVVMKKFDSDLMVTGRID